MELAIVYALLLINFTIQIFLIKYYFQLKKKIIDSQINSNLMQKEIEIEKKIQLYPIK